MRHRFALLLVVVLLLALGGSGVVWRMARERVARERAAPKGDGRGPGSTPERVRAVDDARTYARGVVVDEGGAAVAGAQVAAFPLTLGAPFDPSGAGTRTGAGGRFRVALAGHAPAYGLFVRAAGFAPRVVEPVRPGDEVCIVLARGATLFGRVTDLAGEVVAGAQVRYVGLLAGVRVVAETVSATDGAYRVATAPGAPAHVAVSAAGFAPLLVIDGPFQGERDLVLTCGGTVRATVVDGDTDKPVVGVAVRLWAGLPRNPIPFLAVVGWFPPQGLLGERVTNQDGVAEFEGVPSLGFHFGPGTMLGFAELRDAGSFATDVEVAMPEAGATVECRLVRMPAGTLVGRVVDEEGAPLAGVVLRVGSRAVGAPVLRVRSDARGRYRAVMAAWSGMPAYAFVWAESGGEAHGTVVAGRTTHMPDLVLLITDVEVVDEAGVPVWGAGVSFGNDTVSAFTDEAGHARLRGKRGTHVYVRPREHAFAVAQAAPRVRVVVERGAPVAGRVVWKDDEPAAGALVRLGQGVRVDPLSVLDDVTSGLDDVTSDLDDERAAITTRTYTDADGAFRFAHVPAGPCQVSAHVSCPGSFGRIDLVARAKDVPAGTSDLRLVFDRENFVPVVTVRGTVKDITTGKPIARFRVKLYNTPRIITARNVGVGRFEVGVPKGEWWVDVSAPGYVEKSFDWEVRPGVPLPDQEFVLQPATTVTGRIRSLVPLVGGKVELRKTDNDWFAGESTIDAEGNYSVGGVPPGEYLARVTVGQTALTDRGWRTVGVRAGVAEVRFDFEVEPGGVLRVRVQGFQDLRGPDSIGVLTILDSEGIERVHLDPYTMFPNTWHLPPGTYRVTILSPKVRGMRAAPVRVGNRTDIVFGR